MTTEDGTTQTRTCWTSELGRRTRAGTASRATTRAEDVAAPARLDRHRAHARRDGRRAALGAAATPSRTSNALGALTGNQAVQQVRAGLKAIYLSGWQVAADANLAGHMYPGPEPLSRRTPCPQVVKRINQALQRADQIDHVEGRAATHWFAPIIADAEAGFGGALNAFELMKMMIEAGAAAVHFEDQLASEKKCGHLGGKVLVPDAAVHPHAGRGAAGRRRDGRADAGRRPHRRPQRDAAHQRHRRARSSRSSPASARRKASSGSSGGLELAIARGHRVRAVRGRALVRDLDARPRRGARGSPKAMHAKFPGKLLAYNCSPSFNWAKKLDAQTDRELPARARRDGLQVPVRHAGRLPRAELLDVRAGPRLRRGHGRVLARCSRRSSAGAGSTAIARRSTSAKSARGTSTRSRR